MAIKEFPKPHFSFSSMTLFEASPKTWYKRYILGQKTFETKFLQKGKEFAQALEDEESEDLIINAMLPYIEKLEAQEVEVSAPFDNEIFPGLKLLGKKDTATGTTATGEYKTGSVAWDQAKADKHGQIVFYALIDRLNGAEVPPTETWYQWFETETLIDAEGRKTVEFTGTHEKIKIKVTKAMITNMEKRVLKVLKEIAAYEYEEVLELEGNALARYGKLDRLEKLIADEKKKLKAEVEDLITMAGADAAENEDGKLYFKNNPPKYTFSAATQKKIAALDKILDNEKKTGIATKTVTKSLTWQAAKPKKE